MKILVGPTGAFAGSHGPLVAIPGMPSFVSGAQFLTAVERHKPDVVFLQGSGHNGIDTELIKMCPVPVVGFCHDWICWGSERLEILAKQVDWLVTEKTACQYLSAVGIENHSHFIMMAKDGVERGLATGKTRSIKQDIDVSFLGGLVVDGYKDLFRNRAGDPKWEWDQAYLARAGQRLRSPFLRELADMQHVVRLVAARPPQLPGQAFCSGNSASHDLMCRSKINLNLSYDRKHMANRVFEILGMGGVLLSEADNEIVDFMPADLVNVFELGSLADTVDNILSNYQAYEAQADAAKAFAIDNFKSDALHKNLIKLIERNWDKICERKDLRHASTANYGHLNRAYVHIEEPLRAEFNLARAALEANLDNCVSCIEAGWMEVEAVIKNLQQMPHTQKMEYLDNALHLFDMAIEKNPLQMISYWNKAVVLHLKAKAKDAFDVLVKAGEILSERIMDCRFEGSPLELRIENWSSGHIEPAMAFAKMQGQNKLLTEIKGFLYRRDMFIHQLGAKNENIHWPELPDEHTKTENWEMVDQLDPLYRAENPVRETIYDLNPGKFKFIS